MSEIAADQWGLVTTAQADTAGVSRVNLARLADADLLHHVSRSVYQIAGATPTAHLSIKLAWLRLDPHTPAWQRVAGGERSGTISHASACQLHDLGDIPTNAVQISVPRRRTTREPAVILHQAIVPPVDITMVDGLPVTTVDRTISDLLMSRTDAGHVGRVLAEADQRGLTDTRRLADRVQPYARSYGLGRNATGTELLENLAGQAGFLLRDQQLTTAGEQAVAFTALRSQLALQETLRRIAIQDPNLQEAIRNITIPSAAIQEAIRNITIPSAAIQEAIRNITIPSAAIQAMAALPPADSIEEESDDLATRDSAASTKESN